MINLKMLSEEWDKAFTAPSNSTMRLLDKVLPHKKHSTTTPCPTCLNKKLKKLLLPLKFLEHRNFRPLARNFRSMDVIFRCMVRNFRSHVRNFRSPIRNFRCQDRNFRSLRPELPVPRIFQGAVLPKAKINLLPHQFHLSLIKAIKSVKAET